MCSPKNKYMPLVLKNKHNNFDPYYLGIGESSMNKSELQEVTIAVLTLQAHKFLHVRNINADNYLRSMTQYLSPYILGIEH